ncbi:GIY-YIG nuclease family protein [Priestia flexa]|nr:GIY-YIG nuclease family protein [Priestia flexa]
MSLTIDFAKLDVIKSLVPVQQVQSLSSKKGLYFLFDTEKELVYIGSTMNSLKQRVFAHLKSGDFQENQPIAFIGWLEIEGSKETIEALKTMLINAYFPIYNQYGIKYKHKRYSKS